MWPFRSDPAKKATGPLREFYEVTPPDAGTPLDEARLLAVDVETTGLKPDRHQLVSIGWVPVNGQEIDLSGAGYVILRGTEGFSVGPSATIHHLTDDEIAAGVDPKEALTQFLEALQGRAMLAHFAPMETGFISAACQESFGAGLNVPIVDTFSIERRHMERMGTYPRGEDLRLARVRQRYGLPSYRNHNALTDALACAEQYLAHRASLSVHNLRDLMD
ncbi:exonuclease domain-containing protein [Corynebacterium alimapuense]|uniref:DNA polymerase III subunit epsilon n=1 Tax=Corynebacterium alimapuense TaxID=1576874 RepID=A0A3M8K5G4_9CORY|nr:exonuclease domain-containing protein [Corynebacterium alimapuense]RNE48340.1 DNA polymerase III subunit epsilon [Corynebacterium alimapuense]